MSTSAIEGALATLGTLLLLGGITLWGVAAQQGFTAPAAAAAAPPGPAPAAPKLAVVEAARPDRARANDPPPPSPMKPPQEEVAEPPCASRITFIFGPAAAILGLGEEQRDSVESLATSLPDWPDAKVIIEGHASAPGSFSANLRISHQRAREVRRLLLEAGIPRKQIVLRAYGEYQPPLDDDHTSASRRAVVHIDGAPLCHEERA